MPWRGPEHEGEFPSPGWDILEWIEEYLIVPDGPLAGEPLMLTDEQARILVRFYRVDEDARPGGSPWWYNRAAIRRPQGWGKSPLLAAIALAEACGPTRFDGWDANGEPVAVRPDSPLVQIAAVSEDQAGNTYNAMLGMARDSKLAGDVLDIGITRMYVIDQPRGGTIEPVTASAASRLGQRVSFAVLDETHLWTPRNGGHTLEQNIRRGAAKMAKAGGGRIFESTNAHALGEDSVAEKTFKAAQRSAKILYDAQEAPFVEDLTDHEAVKAALSVSYSDSVAWIDLDRLADECADPGTDPNAAYRFFFNLIRAGGECPFDLKQWELLATPDRAVQDGERVALGFDGSISDDSTALYGCTEDGFVFEIRTWDRPLYAVGDWHVPRLEVHDAVRDAFARWDVGLMLCDPPQWRTELEQWHELYKLGDKPADARVLPLETNQAARFAPACDRFATAIREGAVSHAGEPAGKPLTLNLAACARKQVRVNDDGDDGRTKWVIVKADTRKIDRAVAGVLAYQAAMTMPPAKPKNALRWLQQLKEERDGDGTP